MHKEIAQAIQSTVQNLWSETHFAFRSAIAFLICASFRSSTAAAWALRSSAYKHTNDISRRRKENSIRICGVLGNCSKAFEFITYFCAICQFHNFTKHIILRRICLNLHTPIVASSILMSRFYDPLVFDTDSPMDNSFLPWHQSKQPSTEAFCIMTMVLL